MPTTTHKITILPTEYTAVSNGNLNCAIFLRFNQHIRVVVGGEQPDPDSDVWIDYSTGHDEYSGLRRALSIGNLAGEDELWVRASGEYEDTIFVVRGEATSG